MITKQLICFVLSGGIAAASNWSSRFLFSHFFSFELAIFLSFFVGLLSGFILMRLFVFDGGGKPVVLQAGKYILVNLFALVQTFLISLIFARWFLPMVGFTENSEAWGHLVGVLVPVVTSYFGHKFLTFR